VRVTCPNCGKNLKVPEHALGKRVTCPACSQKMSIPDTAPTGIVATAPNHDSPQDQPSGFTADIISKEPQNELPNRASEKSPLSTKQLASVEAIEPLKQAYQDFAKPHGKTMMGFGCMMLLVILAAIVLCATGHWLIGILGGIGTLVVLVVISNAIESPLKKRAQERIAELESEFGLSHEQSLDLLKSTRTKSIVTDKNEWKAFVGAVWGPQAVAAMKNTGLPISPPGGEMVTATDFPEFIPVDLKDVKKVTEIVLETAKKCDSSKMYVTDQIPDDKATNARQSCEIPAAEELLVLFDCTSFGSAKNCIAITTSAVYGHSDWSGKTPGTVKVPFAEIHASDFADGGFGEISIAGTQYLNVAAAGSKTEILAFLNTIRVRLVGAVASVPSATICPRCKKESVEVKAEFKSSTAGHVAGQLMFGIVGNIVAGAVFGKTTHKCTCKSCGYKWTLGKAKQ